MKGAGCIAVLVIIGLIVGAYVGLTMLLGWIGFLLYRHYAPEAWAYIGLWPWVGIAFLVNMILRPVRAWWKLDA